MAVQNLTLDDDRIFEPANESHFAPGPTYIAPNPSLLFEVANNSLSFKVYLPSRAVADSLIARYWLAVDPVAKMMHRPTFEKQYEDFWLNVSEGLEPYHSLQALVFATLFSATASMQADDVLTNYRIPQKKLRESFQLGTEMALAKARFLRTNKTQTLQALVMYLVCSIHGGRLIHVNAGRFQCVDMKFLVIILLWLEQLYDLRSVWASTVIQKNTIASQ